MNFGFTGMYLCAFFVGLLLAGVERLSYFFLRGYFFFTYIVFMIPMVNFGIDLGTMLNNLVVCTGSLTIFRTVFLRMARRDEYS